MEDDTPGSRKRGLFCDASQEPSAKAARCTNAEFLAAFRAFDTDRSGFIELAELGSALQAVQSSVETNSPRSLLFQRPFQFTTSCWLCARFGDGSRLTEIQFCELLGYVSNLKTIFEQIDLDHSCSIECGELHRAFQLSGVSIGEDVVAQIGRSFDTDNTGTLEFDEFVQMRLEWDCYTSAWDACTRGGSVIQPEQLLSLLEELKRTLEPVGTVLVGKAEAQILMAQGLFYSSMFKVCRPFQPQTCQWLIIRFGEGNLSLNFGQFCSMLVFLKEVKTAFARCDTNGNGSLSLDELANAFSSIGMQLPTDLVMQIGRNFDSDNSGEIEFDEFVQMAVEWNEMLKERSHFEAQTAGRVTAAMLQGIIGNVRVIYGVMAGSVSVLRPFSLNTCRWLVAIFGTPLPGEAFAHGVAWNEFLVLVQYLKSSHTKYLQCDFRSNGIVSTEELRLALVACGINLAVEVVDNIRRSYDTDNSGSFEFDEFIQLLVECRLYDQCFEARLAQPTLLTPLNRISPVLGQSLAGAGQGLIMLDKSAFFSMVFAVPRNLQ
mmetsp:Transcript_117457/g.292833  ORF Transcript_117457/g.292833 Transcript_117457/m.292833 type:complete len:546 (+) Transcript_117457:92-1729(+)|eukprot:CAMPEP_0115634520 /NCGR_PEP_ID=MMETSP0272-20121206/32626_1 /TAXON_ID=71861 /ORGANISM="Scrippsiella trochoidea, Strain CCMP3099" /LENGTH=545 /DNA_ID=CAMNT_0003071357 /DNA_START=20 /DNA_END=1657 /DNA_ORIENTATION=-